MDSPEPGSFEAAWSAAEPTCVGCGCWLGGRESEAGWCWLCQLGKAPERPRPVLDCEPVAVCWPRRYCSAPVTFWACGSGVAAEALEHARRFSRLAGGRIDVLSDDTSHQQAPTARQAGHSRRTPTPSVELIAEGAEVPRG